MNNNYFYELAKNRYSVRKFKPEPVSKETMQKILDVALLAPTACNKQAFKIIVVDSAEGLSKFRKCTMCHFDAPNALIILANKEETYKRDYDGKPSGDIDCSIVTTHLMLEAYELGVGSTWVMHFIPEAVVTEFNVPETYEPVAILTLGYPAEDAKPAMNHTKSKSLDDILLYNDFTNQKQK